MDNGNNSWFIANNHFYQTSSRSLSNTHTGAISISSGAAYSIISNFIGGSEPNCGGASLTYTGAGLGTFIRLNIPANNTSVLLGNTIQNISLNCTNYIGLNALIFLQNGAFNIVGNTLGSDQNNLKININNATGTAQFSPIYVGGGSSYGETQITYNTISGMNIGTGGLGAIHFIGVHIVPAIPSLVISDNLIGSLTQNNNIINTTSGYTFGISGPASASQTSIISNTIGNIFSSSADTNAFVRGISISSGGSFILKNNRIFRLSAQNAFARTGVNASLIGILQQASGLDQVCENNQVSELYLSNQGTLANNHIYGIWYAGSSSGTNILSGNFGHTLGSSRNGLSSIIAIYNGNSAVTASNNRIRLGIDSLGNSQSENHSFIGLQDQGNSNSYYHNSIYIGGQTAGTASANSMSFFNAIGSTGTRNIINNIFFNARTFTTGTAKNYAFFLTSNSLVEFLLDHNIYFAPNTGAIMGRFNNTDYTNLNTWRAATFSDFNSGYGNPNFVNPNAALGALTLKIQSPTPAEGSGMLIPEIGEDFESESRVSMTPNDIGADAGNYTQVDIFIPSIDYLPLSNTSSTANRNLQVQIKDPGAGVNNSSSLKPRLYFRRIAPTATAWQSTQGTLNSGTTRDGIWSFTIDYSLIGLPVVLGNGYQYYVVVQDSANPANIFFSPFAGANHVSVNSMVTAPTTPNRYNIVSTLPTNIQVGIGQTYTSLSGTGGLFAAINAGVLGGNTVATLVSNTSETGVNALTNAGLSGFNLLIKPDNSQRVISGGVNTGLLGMIAINGAVGVTIDGGPNKNLVFRNAIGSTPNASTAPAMRIRSGKFDTIQNCIIEGNSSNNGVGVLNLGTINISSPSEGIVIQNNQIRPPLNDSLNAPNTSIIVNSAAGNINKCRISGNFISDFNTYGIYVANAGKEVIIGDALDSSKGNIVVQRRGRSSVFYSILVGSGNSHVIGHNKIYNQQIFGHNAPIYGIYVFNAINNINITHNSIGGSEANRSGEPYRNAQLFTPILVNAGNIQTTTIQYNKIGNISLNGSSGTFTGIYGIGGKLLIQHNSIGNGQNSGLIHDTIGAAFNVYGIRYTSTSNVSILNNAMGSFANNGTGFTVGISIENGTANIANNTICDVSAKNSVYNNVDYSCVGIRISGGTSDNNIENNRIYNLSNTSNINGASITGIAVVGAIKASNIHRNRLYNFLTNDSRTGVNSPIVRGIYLASGASIYHNNQISLSQDIPFKNVRIRGIEVNTGGGNNQFFYNAIYIGGVSYGANNSAAFIRNTSGTTTAVEVVNNILYNERSGGGLHYGLSANQNTNFIQDNNLYVAKTNTEMAEFPFGTSRNLTAWNGLSGNPLYNISNTNIALLADSFFANKNIGNLSTQSCRVANLAAYVSVQTDFLNQTRNIPSDIGSTEFNTVLGYPTINVQPISDTINCAGGNAFFAIKASGSGLQYQWQIWDSTQWLNLSENALYTGVNTDTLHIILPNTNLHGKLYRCLARGVCSGADSSSSARLHMITNNFWTGAISTNWNNTGNWSCGVLPTANTDAIINNVSNLPIISDSTMTCFKLSIAPGASLTLNNAASKLAIYGNTELNGSLINANGTIAFAGNTLQNIPGNSFHKLEINNATGTQITGNVQVVNQINLVNGTIQLNQFNLSLMGNTSQIYGASSANKFIVSNDTGCLVIQQIGTGNRTGVVQFPIGSNQNSYTPLSIQNTGISDDFRARVMPQVYNQYAANGTPMGAAYTSLAVNKTWYVREAIVGGSNANVSFTWNIADELLAFNRSSSYAASYAGAQWLGGTASMAGGVNPYVQSLSGQTSFNLFGVASGGILPVNLIQFYGQKADEHVQLYWQTASEKNSKTFEIERSLLGIAFEKVGEIAAAGNSETKRMYQFADYSIQRQASYFYRLKQIDLDGSIAYSRVIYIPENSLGSDKILVYPNPFTENIFIKTLAFTETILAVNMYDLKGNKVYSETNLSNSAVSLNKLANISAGMYFLEVETKLGTQRIKLLKE
ncbi:MAG: T9SS type A sorting domain-containing protein [Bacteroidota bacterium]|nr:T9SS type A sorting domain-containing protein [Bacteroidota bacterium]